MSERCKARIELVYADPEKRQPGESWSEQCHLDDDGHRRDGHQLHAVEIQWLGVTTEDDDGT